MKSKEQVNEAVKIIEQIEQIEEQIKVLSVSERFINDTTRIHSENGQNGYLWFKYVDFELLKTLTLASLNKRLTELQNEFNQL